MTDNVSKQIVYVPTIDTGAHVSQQRVFVTIAKFDGARVSRQRIYVPIIDTGSASGPRRRQPMIGTF